MENSPPNVQLRLSLAIARLLKVSPVKLARAMRTKYLQPYAEELYHALGKELEQTDTSEKSLTEQ